MSYHDGRPTIDQQDRRRVLKLLGVTGAAVAASEVSLEDMREGVGTEGADELATMGNAIRADLTGELDAALVASATADIGAQFEKLPELHAQGLPAEIGSSYAALAEPGQELYDHLVEVGFFSALEDHLPGFTESHIQDTAREFVRAEPLTAALTGVGFNEAEVTTLVTKIVNEANQLALWVPTSEIPEGVEFDVAAVAPVHQRAVGGALLWIQNLDQHLWQKQILITEQMLEDGLWDVKAMLGGLHLFGKAASAIAGNEDLTESQLTAALTGGAAALISGQQDITNDLFRITEDMRAPRTGGN